MKTLALRIYKDPETLLTVITTRTGLKVNDATGEVDNNLTEYNGKSFVLFDIEAQKEINKGVIEQGQLGFGKPENKKSKGHTIGLQPGEPDLIKGA